MKKIVYIFVAALLMVACKPNNEVVDGKVRLTVSMDDNQSNKSQQRISAIDNGSAIDLTWEEDDVLTAYDGTTGDTIGTFTLIKGAGTKIAVFESDNFNGAPENFTLIYQGEEYKDKQLAMVQTVTMTEKDGNRTYQLDKDKKYLKLEAKNCKIGGGIQMQPCFSLLGVQLKSKESCVFTGSVYLGKVSPYCASTIGSIDLKGGGIYYYVFPNDLAEDTKTNFLGVGSRIFLNEGEGGDASNPNAIILSKAIELNPYQATIVTLWVTKNNSGTGQERYTLSRTQP